MWDVDAWCNWDVDAWWTWGFAPPTLPRRLANQEVLRWLEDLQAELGDDPTEEEITAYVKSTLGKGKVVPGYGHAVLRKTDPRYSCQREFAKEHMPDFELFKVRAWRATGACVGARVRASPILEIPSGDEDP